MANHGIFVQDTLSERGHPRSPPPPKSRIRFIVDKSSTIINMEEWSYARSDAQTVETISVLFSPMFFAHPTTGGFYNTHTFLLHPPECTNCSK